MRHVLFRFGFLLCELLVGSNAVVPNAFAQSDSTHTGTTRGSVRSAQTHQPISHAKITLQGTGLGALTQQNGEYRIEHVPVSFRSLGYDMSSER